MPNEESFRLPRNARLRLKRHITPLFSRERDDVGSLAVGCVRVVFRVVPKGPHMAGVLAGFAPGRQIRGAVGRNQIKRYLREVYRVHQHELVDLFHSGERSLTMMFLFRGQPGRAQACIREDLPALLAELARRLRDDAGHA